MILLAFQMLSRLGKPFSLFFLSLQTQFVAMLRTNLPPYLKQKYQLKYIITARATKSLKYEILIDKNLKCFSLHY